MRNRLKSFHPRPLQITSFKLSATTLRRWLLSLLLVVGFGPCLMQEAMAARIEADRGKSYTLTKRHGPWMIMVATFNHSLRGEEKQQLINAENAAHELVLELRMKGIPAYVYNQQGELAEVESVDRRGQQLTQFVAAKRSGICVLAGNYRQVDDEVAQKTLKYIKSLNPQALKNGIYKSTPGRRGPLSRAFLTLNPLLSQDEIFEATRKRDPLLIQLNGGGDYNLTENPKKYSLIVASFYGKKHTAVLNTGNQESERFLEFDRELKTSSKLDEAALESWELVKAMRAQGMEAYVYHDHYRSIVAVGGFDSPQDPKLRALYKNFSAKYQRNPTTGEDVLVCEAIQIKESPNSPPLRMWILDPQPQLIAVPRLR